MTTRPSLSGAVLHPSIFSHPDKYFGVEFATCVLEVNYRSPKNVVDHSQLLIAHNSRRVPKTIRAHSASNALIKVVTVASLPKALKYVDKVVNAVDQHGETSKRIALISRKRSQIIPYQIFFASRDLPFYAAEDLQVFLSAAFDRLLELLSIKSGGNGRKRPTDIVRDLLYLCDLVKRFSI